MISAVPADMISDEELAGLGRDELVKLIRSLEQEIDTAWTVLGGVHAGKGKKPLADAISALQEAWEEVDKSEGRGR